MQLEDLLEIHENRRPFERLRQQFDGQPQVVPFVGAGLSAACGLRDWAGYLRDLGASCSVEMRSRVSTLVDAGQFEEAAEAVREALGESDLDQRLDDDFGPLADPRISLRGPLLTLPRIAGRFVVTTNFDGLLERAFRDAGRPFDLVLLGDTLDDFTWVHHRRYSALLKIHGDVRLFSTRVLTQNDYIEHYGDPDPERANWDGLAVPRALRTLFQRHSCLFLGSSLRGDRTLRLLGRVVREVKARNDLPLPHYAVVELGRGEDPVQRRRDLQERYGIVPILFPAGEYGAVESVLRALAEVARPPSAGVASPPPPRTPEAGFPIELRAVTRTRARAMLERPLFVSGPASFGKTSFVRAFWGAVQSAGDRAAFVSVGELARGAIPDAFRLAALHLAEACGVEPESAGAAWDAFDDGRPADRLVHLLDRTLLPALGRHRLFLCLDGLEEVAPVARRELASECSVLLRALAERHASGVAPWQRFHVTATSRLGRIRLAAQLTGLPGSDFHTRFENETLYDLEGEELRTLALATAPGVLTDPVWSEVLPAISAHCGGHPHYLRLLLSDVESVGALRERLADPWSSCPKLRNHLEYLAGRVLAHPEAREAAERALACEGAPRPDNGPGDDVLYVWGMLRDAKRGGCRPLDGVVRRALGG